MRASVMHALLRSSDESTIFQPLIPPFNVVLAFPKYEKIGKGIQS
jgi:hypothetical protein